MISLYFILYLMIMIIVYYIILFYFSSQIQYSRTYGLNEFKYHISIVHFLYSRAPQTNSSVTIRLIKFCNCGIVTIRMYVFSDDVYSTLTVSQVTGRSIAIASIHCFFMYTSKFDVDIKIMMSRLVERFGVVIDIANCCDQVIITCMGYYYLLFYYTI